MFSINNLLKKKKFCCTKLRLQNIFCIRCWEIKLECKFYSQHIILQSNKLQNFLYISFGQLKLYTFVHFTLNEKKDVYSIQEKQLHLLHTAAKLWLPLFSKIFLHISMGSKWKLLTRVIVYLAYGLKTTIYDRMQNAIFHHFILQIRIHRQNYRN